MPRGKIVPTIKELTVSTEPLAMFSSIKDRSYSFFLDSACDPEKLGRYSFMGCDPFLMFRSKGDHITLERFGRKEELRANPFAALKKLFKEYAVEGVKGVPFVGGGVGYFSYDLKDFIEDLPNKSEDDLDIPDCVLGFYDSVVIYDNLKKRSYISDLGLTKKSAKILKEIVTSAPVYNEDAVTVGECGRLKSNFSKSSYITAVNKAKDYIKKGDIYQVNISQRFETTASGDPFDLYVRLRNCSPAPFAAYLNFNDVVILSSSPERFLSKQGSRVETRPIKGTRPRGVDAESDLQLEEELKNSYKDAAEHIMIVDLERNDLGRICRYGSVAPTESAVIERYANVFHLVSTVSGRLKTGVGPIDCIISAFPGGSITGAPKIRSMEIIDELEGVKRSVYTGAIGYIGFDGNMDTSIVIRTFIIKGKKLYFQVGGGIVADSDPENEYEETLHKAAGLMQALGVNR